MTEPIKPTFDELLARARKGTDADWAFVDQHLGPEHLTEERVTWARKHGVIDADENARDFAATVIAHSDVPLHEVDMAWLIGPMVSNAGTPPGWWLANALYKRGDRDPEVVAMWENACQQDNPAGEFARKLKETTTA